MKLTELNSLELSAAMRGGTHEWGQYGSAFEHIRYVKPASPKSRRRCHCGCKQRATHLGMANGVCLLMGCELSMHRWVKNPCACYRAALHKEGQG